MTITVLDRRDGAAEEISKDSHWASSTTRPTR